MQYSRSRQFDLASLFAAAGGNAPYALTVRPFLLRSDLAIGSASGLVIRSGTATSNMASRRWCCKSPPSPGSVRLYAFDARILPVQTFFHPSERVFVWYLAGDVLHHSAEKTLLWDAAYTEVKIVSQKSVEISTVILFPISFCADGKIFGDFIIALK